MAKKKDVEERGFGRQKGQNPVKLQGNGVFWGYLKPKKHKQAKQNPQNKNKSTEKAPEE